jgi:hypothetical protein
LWATGRRWCRTAPTGSSCKPPQTTTCCWSDR